MYSLLSSHSKNKSLQQKFYYQLGQMAKNLLGAVEPEEQALLPREYNLDAHVFHRQFASTHYGIMIPDLPEPFRYLSYASVIGDVGAKITHLPKSISGLSPENTATLVHGTALSTDEEAFRIYNIQDEIVFHQKPFKVEFGRESFLAEIEGSYHLVSERDDLQVDLWLTPTPAITWFAHSMLYQHFSVLMQYEGHLTQHGKRVEVKGLCTLEHWKAVSSSMLPSPIKPTTGLVPLDSFSYQVINIDDESQLVLAYIGFAGEPTYTAVSYRHIDGTSIQYDGEVAFQVIALKPDPKITPDGFEMEVPQSFRWIAHHQGEKVLDILAVADTEYCYGLAAGYVSSYQWSGLLNGTERKGRGYVEYIDRRQNVNLDT